ncbi:MFS general substrate transporter [Aureobasidium subglaciale]|nr:MFS general substrate transporter [Aureobasidium subglaciale]KAI5214084.1 MFS general substrate transporter [Aureobasidium subglaciale]KAI5216476.1 MFS general substrate transporter [Aureobasidium subglaciale]KAI5254420.1 MFS general substrate transporter [Aureobasidium subglaciale]
MQSYLQYKRFRRVLEGQIEKDRNRTRAVDRANQDLPPTDASRADDPEKDVERGESDTSSGEHTVVDESTYRVMTDNQHHHHGLEEEEEKYDASAGRNQLPLNSHDTEARQEENNGDLSRTATTKSGRSGLSRSGTALGRILTGVKVRKREGHEGGEGNVFIVDFQGEKDELNPHNWSWGARLYITFLVASIGFVVGVASSIDSVAIQPASQEFGISEVAESLATGLYLIGFGAGALFAGPFSETLGRNPIYIVTLLVYMAFLAGAGASQTYTQQFATRFFAGFFGSTPLTWVEWITIIMSGLVWILVFFTLPETFPPILLKWKAAHLRSITNDDRYRAEAEVRMDPFFTRLGRACYRPFLLTATEPIIILIALYLTVVYIVLFTFLDGYDFIFGEIHGVSIGIQGLCFLGIAIGLFLATPLVFVVRRIAAKEMQKAKENGKDKVAPEFRLWFAMFGAPAIPISLFWMGWTSYPNISIWSPLAASVLFGYGILCIFISSYQYIIDAYEVYAASALASITLIRYVAAGGMTIVGVPFYKNLGVHYTCTILACISAVMVPVPYVFFLYGHKIRARSKYAPSD